MTRAYPTACSPSPTENALARPSAGQDNMTYLNKDSYTTSHLVEFRTFWPLLTIR
jgi:hypothetical protein